jgi:hypothetical protein
MSAPEPTAHSDNMPVVFDLDGTLAEATWPSNHIGNPIQEGIELMLHYSSLGFGIVIHTARPASHEKRIWKWLRELGLQNVVFDVVTGKPLGWLYVDDRSYCPDFVERSVKEPPAAPEGPVRDTRKKPEKIETRSDPGDDLDWEPDSEGDDRPVDWDDPEIWTPVG